MLSFRLIDLRPKWRDNEPYYLEASSERIMETEREKRSMIEIMTGGMRVISDSGNPLVSKAIFYFGSFVGIGGSSVQILSESSAVRNNKHMSEIANYCAAASPDWLVYIPAIGVASLVIKNVTDIIFRRLEHKKIMNETKTDKDNLC